MAELALTVESAGGQMRQDSLDFAEVFENPTLLMQRVELLGHQLRPTAVDLEATYLDDAGRECALTAATAAEAAALALESSGLVVFIKGICSDKEDLVVVASVGDGAAGGVPIRGTETVRLADVRADPGLLVGLAARLGRQALGGGAEAVVTYRDEEGDACTLNEQTAHDALAFAVVGEDGRHTLHLNIQPVARVTQTFRRPQADGKAMIESQAKTELSTAATDLELAEVRGELEEVLRGSAEKDQTIHELQQELLDERKQANEQIHLLTEEVDAQQQRSALLAAEAKTRSEDFEKQLQMQSEQRAAEERQTMSDAMDAIQRADEELAERLACAQRAEEAAVKRAEGAERRSAEQSAEYSASLGQLKQQLASAEKEAEEGVERAKQAAATNEARLQSELAEARQEVEEAERRTMAAQDAEHSASLAHEAARRELLRAEEEMDRLRNSCSELSSEAASLHTARDEQARKAASMQESAQSLQKELENAQREVSEAKEKVANIQKEAENTQALDAAMSGLALSSEPEIAGVEDHLEDPSARRDVSNEFAEELKRLGCRQAFRIGRVQLRAVPKGELLHEECFPVCYSVVFQNNGSTRWPATAALVHASGDAMDLPLLPLVPLRPGERTKLDLDLRVPQTAQPREPMSTSTWVLRDAATGKPLGPVLIFDVQWTGEAAV